MQTKPSVTFGRRIHRRIPIDKVILPAVNNDITTCVTVRDIEMRTVGLTEFGEVCQSFCAMLNDCLLTIKQPQ
jgi:hypothetical protein